jgi:hypothetical protein
VSRVAGNPGYDTASARDQDQVYNAGPNGFVVFHGDMGTLSLSPEQRAAFLHAGPPNPQAFANSEGVVDGRLHQAAVQFYQEAARLGTSS